MLQTAPSDGQALRTLGEWNALAGDELIAQELLERAEKAGAGMAGIELANLYWKNDLPDAARRADDRAVQTGGMTRELHALRR